MENKVSVLIPAHNEEKNLENVINVLKNNNNDEIIDEIIVIDNASTDKTHEIAAKAGATVLKCVNQGKGYAMETGLEYAKNEIIVFLDADIDNYDKDLIKTLIKPIIYENADFVKSRFERKGGRITELVAKPLLDITFSNIYKFSQPLSGMIAGKREYFKKVKFEKDYGVDIGILLDMVMLGANIEEVHIGKINNDSQPWIKLEKMSKEVMTAILKRCKDYKGGNL